MVFSCLIAVLLWAVPMSAVESFEEEFSFNQILPAVRAPS
jgi:hypothetical protein